MSIVYPLSMPAVPGPSGLANIAPSGISLFANFVVAKNISPYTKQMQGYIHPGTWWTAKVSLPGMTRAQAEPWIAFLIALWGRSGKFLLGDPAGTAPIGNAGGSPVVNGGSQVAATPQTLAIRSLTGTLKAGDYFSIGSGVTQRLYKNLTDQGPGTVTLDIFPSLREIPADGAALTLANAQGVFELDTNTVQWDIDAAKNYTLSFSAMESI